MAIIPPSRLWQQATDEYPDDDAARRARYRELMEEQKLLYLGDDEPPWTPLTAEEIKALDASVADLDAEECMTWDQFPKEGR